MAWESSGKFTGCIFFHRTPMINVTIQQFPQCVRLSSASIFELLRNAVNASFPTKEFWKPRSETPQFEVLEFGVNNIPTRLVSLTPTQARMHPNNTDDGNKTRRYTAVFV